MLQQGLNLECFIEGGRSRTGKLLGPKFGFLSFVLDSILSGRVEDAYICPVSLQYDKVLEVDSYVNELLGKPKEKESLTQFLSASSVLSLNLGRIDCRFHEPWSLKDFIQEQQTRQRLNVDLSVRDLSDRTRLLRTLGYRVLSDINEASVIMPTALVGTVLLTIRGRGIGKSELVRRVDALAARVKAKGSKVADFKGMPTSHVVERALEVLGPKLVGTVDGLAEETYYAVDRFQLSFYRNMTIHVFVSEALIAAALYSKVKQGGGSSNERMQEVELIERVGYLSQLFRGEFIFP
jgi:glycerol-3-phosphate O-acyltransferase